MQNDWFQELFGARQALIGMVHVGPLPGAPGWGGQMGPLIDRALEEASAYAQAGFQAIMLENMYDRPYLIGDAVGPETVAAMSVLAWEVRRQVALPLGLQILAGANEQALAVAVATGASFLRVEGFAYAHVADEGWIEGCAGSLLRARDRWRAGHVKIFADIKKKHSSHAITADLSLAEVAHGHEFCMADGLIVTGASTGMFTNPEDLAAVTRSSPLPVLVGSGVNPSNFADYSSAQGWIVGSWVKQGGHWDGPLDRGRLIELRSKLTT